jgi:hypothetical protein
MGKYNVSKLFSLVTVFSKRAHVTMTFSERFICQWEWTSADESSVVVSPDCRRVAWQGKSEGMLSNSAWVVSDGKEMDLCSKIHESGLKYSPDSSKLAYIVYEGRWPTVIVGDKGWRLPPGGRIASDIQFSSDGKHFVYTTVDLNDLWFATVNGDRPTKGYRAIGRVSLSPNGKRLAFRGDIQGRWMMVIDDEIVGLFHPLDDVIVFSADSSRVAFVATTSNNPFASSKNFVVCDGMAGKHYDQILPESVGFSVDAKHLSYCALLEGRRYLVRDDREAELTEIPGQPDDMVPGSHVQTNDGQHSAWLQESGGWFGKKYSVVCDGVSGPSCRGVGAIRFSPDGCRIAYSAISQDRSQILVVDGKEMPAPGIVSGTVQFSNDGRRIGFIANQNCKYALVIDGVQSTTYSHILNSRFVFDDATHLARFIARAPDKRIVAVEEIATS